MYKRAVEAPRGEVTEPTLQSEYRTRRSHSQTPRLQYPSISQSVGPAWAPGKIPALNSIQIHSGEMIIPFNCLSIL